MSEADHPVTGDLQRRVAGPISLEGGPVAVIGEAVEFDDQLLAGPEHVDFEVED